MFTYTNDERFQVLHAEGSDDWTLQIKYVQKRDNGTYECQVRQGRFILHSTNKLLSLANTIDDSFIELRTSVLRKHLLVGSWQKLVS